MKNIGVLMVIILLMLSADITAQNDKVLTRDIVISEGMATISYLLAEPSFKTHPKKVYWWVEAGEIHFSQGGYSGKVLHGKYELKNKDGDLLLKGEYKKGLKNGRWKYWDESGLIEKVENYKCGEKNGRQYEYNLGSTTKVSNYKKGMLHGDQLEMIDGKLEIVTVYHKGEIKNIEPRNKKLKQKPLKGDESIESKETTKEED